MANLVATKWLDRDSGLWVETAAFNADDSMRFAVRRIDGCCLNKDGAWEEEPFPSSRDEGFLERCRWDCFQDAAVALDRSAN